MHLVPITDLSHEGLADYSRLTDVALRRVSEPEGGLYIAESSKVIERALALTDSPFSAVQSTWNLLEPSVGEALAAANDAKWLVVVKEVLANGRLTSLGEETSAATLAAEDGQRLDALAIGAAVAHPWADIVLTGAVTRKQLKQNLDARPPSLDEERLASLAEPAEQYWKARSARPWS